jgi:hypothetical protein
MTFVMTFHGWVLALCANILVFAAMPLLPMPREDGWLNIERSLVSVFYLAVALFLTPCIWLVWALLK